MFNGCCFVDVAEILGAEHFYFPPLRAIFEAMVELDQQSKPIDIITVAEQMRKSETIGKLKAYNGEAYLAELANSVATIENITHHAKMVRDKATSRRLIDAGSKIVQRGYADELEAAEYSDEAERLVFEAADHASRENALSIAQLTPALVNTLERACETGGQVTPGIATGFGRFDSMTAGLVPSELTLIAARPSMGKSALMLGLAVRCRVPALIFSLEMRKEDLGLRLIASEARVNLQRLRTCPLVEDMEVVRRELPWIMRLPIAIDDSGSLTLMEIRARARRWRARVRGPGIIFVDYLQLVHAPAGREQSREQEISTISRGLKALAKELEVPVVALCQLNRSVESRANKRPLTSDLRESGSLEQDADLICFVYRDEIYNKESKDKGVAEIIIGKQRNGPTGTVRLSYLGHHTRFENLAEGRAEAADPGPPKQGRLL